VKSIEITYRYDADKVRVRPRPTNAREARERLDKGSEAFAALLASLMEGTGVARRVIQVDARDLGLLRLDNGPRRQQPYAVVLGCSDARVPIELIFNEGPNDLFVVRVAGNGLGSEVLGSVRYAIDHLGGSIKLIVVLGHSGCGAVSAAVDVYLNPRTYLAHAANHALRGILDRLLVMIHATARKLAETKGPDVTNHPGYREALIEGSVLVNAAVTAFTLQQEIRSSEADGLCATYGVLLLTSRQIWAPRCGSEAYTGLAHTPPDVAAFGDLGDAVVRSERIATILDEGARKT
jgi:carbonic anhydrase